MNEIIAAFLQFQIHLNELLFEIAKKKFGNALNQRKGIFSGKTTVRQRQVQRPWIHGIHSLNLCAVDSFLF